MDIQSIKARFGIIGNAPALNHALSIANQVSGTDLTVLINGESGVGKEAFSSIIHALSPRKHNNFIAVNCGAIPEGTIDSELFGHEKGAFTGATDGRKGYFETVSGGTIFLDEIGEMPLGTQARLLRVLETGEFIRVGSSKVQKTDVRVIAATNRNLLEQTGTGRFREDLYYRLSTVPIHVPALRDRREDIVLLFRKFASDFAERYRTPAVQLEPAAQQILLRYPWPGNIRELKNFAEQVSVLSVERVITAEQVEGFLPKRSATGTSNMLPALSSMSTSRPAGQEFTTTERDILYKLFFELKRDLNELKQGLFGLAGSGGNNSAFASSEEQRYMPAGYPLHNDGLSPMPPIKSGQAVNNNPGNAIPRLLSQSSNAPAFVEDAHEDVEESLSLMENEKTLIIKALKKHRGRRRDAASELGISERTLYRKIKEYDIEE